MVELHGPDACWNPSRSGTHSFDTGYSAEHKRSSAPGRRRAAADTLARPHPNRGLSPRSNSGEVTDSGATPFADDLRRREGGHLSMSGDVHDESATGPPRITVASPNGSVETHAPRGCRVSSPTVAAG